MYNISQVLGITIIHSIWQGLVIYFMLRILLLFSAQLSSSKKYTLALMSLLAITAWFIYTFVNEVHIYNWLAVKPAKLSAMPLMLELPGDIRQFNDQSIRYYYNIEGYLPYITLLYVAGLLFNTTHLILARKKINTIRQTMSIDIPLQRQVNKFRDMLDIDIRVKIGLSKLVDVPCMVGYFKPIILLPFTLSTYLGTEEIESILLHELAHVKRNDYLVNLLQQVISTLLFFNPCAQLINRIINEERENCCDDLVIQSTPSPVIYAKALLKLEQTRENNMRMAMSATGKKYQLLNRIERIMKTKKTLPSIRPALLAMLILTAGIGCIALLNPEIAQGKISIKSLSPVISNLLSDTTRKTAVKSQKKLPVPKKTTVKSIHTYKSIDNASSYAYRSNNNNNEHNFNYDGFDDAELNKLAAEVNKYGEAVNKYYESPEFKKYEDELNEKSRKIEEFYNRPELKRLQEKQEMLNAEFEKNWGDNDETGKISTQMNEIGRKIDEYYRSPEFKAMNRELEKKYGIDPDKYYDDSENENYKKYEAELDTRISPEIKQQTEELKKMGSKIRGHYNSPERRRQQEEMRAMGDSMRKAFNNPAIKEQQAEMRKLSEQMRNFQNAPEIKKERELLHAASEKLRAYTHSAVYKKRMELYKDWNWNEAAEKPEVPEKPEKPEKPEAPEKPDTTN